MRIILTGATSFTGMWFARTLAESGHEVIAPIRRKCSEYQALRLQRLHLVQEKARVIEDCPFGSDHFCNLLASYSSFDLLCHHASVVEDYKSPAFAYLKAAEQNCQNLPTVLSLLKEKQCRHICLTGSIFEKDEGEGSAPRRAVSPYGLSKTLTKEIFRYYCDLEEMHLGRFVIPNPFGPYEEERFFSYLMQTWLRHESATIKTPMYVRDNIPVQLLAKVYNAFCKDVVQINAKQINPSCYAMSQHAFTSLVQEKMRSRLNIPCSTAYLQQTEFSEPLKRVNTDCVQFNAYNLNEENVWDEIAAYYNQKACPLSVLR